MAPVASPAGFGLKELEPGRALVELATDERHTNPMGRPHAGITWDPASRKSALGVVVVIRTPRKKDKEKLRRDPRMKLGGRCPNCDYPFGAALVQSELHRAGTHLKPGETMVCIGCGVWLVLEVDSQDETLLIVRMMTTEELLKLPAGSLDLMRKATRAIELITSSPFGTIRRLYDDGQIVGHS
jgi:hypothetical protein